MLNFYKLIEILVSLQSLVITSMLPVYIPLPFIYKSSNNFELPITWQIPTIILLTLIFHKKVVFRAFSIYLFLGVIYISCLSSRRFNRLFANSKFWIFIRFISINKNN